MQTISIEWKHFAEQGQTCNRCSSTGMQVEQAVRYLEMICPDENVAVDFEETLLSEEELRQSNVLFFNGARIESLLSGASLAYTSCASCETLSGQESAECRTVDRDGERHETISAELIVEAACQSVGNACCSWQQ